MGLIIHKDLQDPSQVAFDLFDSLFNENTTSRRTFGFVVIQDWAAYS